MSYAVATGSDWYADVPRATRVPTILGISIIALSGIVFGVWGTMAPIAGAVVTSGVFVTMTPRAAAWRASTWS